MALSDAWRFLANHRANVGPPTVIPSSRIADLALGISILGWATLGVWSNLGTRPTSVLCATSLLHFVVGFLFLVRSPAKIHGNFTSCLIAIPAVLIGGWVFQFAPSQWNLPSQLLFCLGSGLAIGSLLYLGRCFAILPAVRGTVTTGPYRWVRHPAYLGELGMVIACLIAIPFHWRSLIVVMVAMTFFVLRIRVEENLLRRVNAYQRYCQQVRWRLMPFLW